MSVLQVAMVNGLYDASKQGLLAYPEDSVESPKTESGEEALSAGWHEQNRVVARGSAGSQV